MSASVADLLRWQDEDATQAQPGTAEAMTSLGTGAVAQPVGALLAAFGKKQSDSISQTADRANELAAKMTYQPRTAAGARVLQAISSGVGSVAHNADEFFGGVPGHILRSTIKNHPEATAAAGLLAKLVPGPAAEAEPAASMLNVGLHIGDGSHILSPSQVIAALEQRGVKVAKHEVRQSGTEPTFVGTLSRPLTPEEAHSMSSDLKQDAIAQVTPEGGALHGPKAAEWGPFNKDYFLEHSPEGERDAFLNDADPNAPMPQLADRYPINLAPVRNVNDDGKVWWGRNKSTEGHSLLDLRTAINKDLDANPDYPRFFDPKGRYYADPSLHPTDQPATINIRPKKDKTFETHTARINNDANVEKLKGLADSVKDIPGAHHWYAMGQAEDEAGRVLGDRQAGATAFDRYFSTPMGATTALADPETNLMSTGFANFQKRSGTQAAMESHAAPPPTSGIALKGNLENADKFDLLSSLNSSDNSKRFNFVHAFDGNQNVGVIDKKMVGIMDGRKGVNAPPDGQYGIYEATVARAAKELGLPVAEGQARPWIAQNMLDNPDYIPHPMIEQMNRAIERTHRITGTPRQEIFNRVFAGMGKPHALYSAAAAGLLGPYLAKHVQDDGT